MPPLRHRCAVIGRRGGGGGKRRSTLPPHRQHSCVVVGSRRRVDERCWLLCKCVDRAVLCDGSLTMSARVFNPLVMSEMRRMIGRCNSDPPSTAELARVRRNLFGTVSQEDAQQFADKELAAIRQREADKWGFDFVNERPTENSRLRWERVTPEMNIPEAYALRRLSFLGQEARTNSSTTSSTQETTRPQRTRQVSKQSQITDFLKCRKRSFSAGDISSKKVGSASLGEISASKVGSAAEPSKRKRSKTRQ